MNGIYCFIDKETDKVVYVGKDSNIDKNTRKGSHFQKSQYNQQQINRVLQNNPERYKYKVLKKGDFNENLLRALEIIYIRRYGTLRFQTGHGFNFTIGGDGMSGYIPSDKTKKKMSKGRSKATNTTGYFRVYKHKNKHFLHGFTYVYQYFDTNKTRRAIRHTDLKKLKEKVLSEDLEWFIINKENAEKTYKEYLQNSKKTNELKNSTGFYKTHILKDKNYKQGFRFVYQYRTDDKRKKISAPDLYKLKEKVLSKNLPWKIISEEKVKKLSIKYNYDIEKLR